MDYQQDDDRGHDDRGHSRTTPSARANMTFSKFGADTLARIKIPKTKPNYGVVRKHIVDLVITHGSFDMLLSNRVHMTTAKFIAANADDRSKNKTSLQSALQKKEVAELKRLALQRSSLHKELTTLSSEKITASLSCEAATSKLKESDARISSSAANPLAGFWSDGDDSVSSLPRVFKTPAPTSRGQHAQARTSRHDIEDITRGQPLQPQSHDTLAQREADDYIISMQEKDHIFFESFNEDLPADAVRENYEDSILRHMTFNILMHAMTDYRDQIATVAKGDTRSLWNKMSFQFSHVSFAQEQVAQREFSAVFMRPNEAYSSFYRRWAAALENLQ